MHFLTSFVSGSRFRRAGKTGGIVAPAIVAAALAALTASSAAQTAPATAPVAAPATAPIAADAPLAPSPVLGMGDEELKDASQVLAYRFSTAAYDAVQQGEVGQLPAAWGQAASYLRAAAALDPMQPHHLRMLWQALEHQGDVAGVIEVLEQYRKLAPDDEVAKLRLIDCYAGRAQTNEKRVAYLNQVLAMPSVSNEIKSRCATWAAAALLERSRNEALVMVNKAVELDPLNIYAQQLHWDLYAKFATPPERLRSLLAKLRCNPSQVLVLASISRELARAGMVREAARWFVATTQLSNRTRQPIDSAFFSDYAAQLYLNGELQLADQEISKVIELDPNNIDAFFLRLVLRQGGEQRVEFERELALARQRFAGQAGMIARQINQAMSAEAPASQPAATSSDPSSPPSTRPFDFNAAFSGTGGGAARPGGGVPSPADAAGPSEKNLADVVAKLKRPDAPPELKHDFIEAITDLAWYEVYFNRSESASITWIDAVKALLGPKDVTSQRLTGWLEILRRNDVEAMKILWPIRHTDPLAGMGVVQLLAARSWVPAPAAGAPATAPANKEYDADELAQQLLDENPSGLVGAMLAAGLKDRKKFARQGPLAESLTTEMKAFNPEFLAIVVQPEQFYFAVGKELESPYPLGKPILAQITLQNTKSYDIPIGPDGIIKPDLWFDARISLQAEKKFPMCGSDRITGALVLKAGQSISQTVRIDQGPLIDALRERPAGSVNIFITMMTNPMLTADLNAIAGPCGIRRQFPDALHRGGLPINTPTNRKRITDMIASNSIPSEKAWALEVMTAYVEETRGANPGAKAMEFGPEMLEHVMRTRLDRVPQIGAVAGLCLLRVPAPAAGEGGAAGPAIDKVQILRQLATSPMWEVRLSAVSGLRKLSPADAVKIATTLVNDPVPVVRSAAAAEVELAPRRAKAGPATQPAS